MVAWSKAQMICIWSRWCHCCTMISCFIKIQIGLTFLVPAYPGCPGKEAAKWLYICSADIVVVLRLIWLWQYWLCLLSEMCLWDLSDGRCLEHTRMSYVHTSIQVTSKSLKFWFARKCWCRGNHIIIQHLLNVCFNNTVTLLIGWWGILPIKTCATCPQSFFSRTSGGKTQDLANPGSATNNNRFTALFPGPTGCASARRELLHFMVQGNINRGRHTDHPAGCHSIWTNQCPPPPSSPHFYAGWMPFLPPNQQCQSTEGN